MITTNENHPALANLGKELFACISHDASAGNQQAKIALDAYKRFDANPNEANLHALCRARMAWANGRKAKAERDYNQFIYAMIAMQIAMLIAIFAR